MEEENRIDRQSIEIMRLVSKEAKSTRRIASEMDKAMLHCIKKVHRLLESGLIKRDGYDVFDTPSYGPAYILSRRGEAFFAWASKV